MNIYIYKRTKKEQENEKTRNTFKIRKTSMGYPFGNRRILSQIYMKFETVTKTSEDRQGKDVKRLNCKL